MFIGAPGGTLTLNLLIKSQLPTIKTACFFWLERIGDNADLLETEPPNQLIWLIILVQVWCNQDGKDGISALNGLLFVHPIERMDVFYPHGRDFHPSRPIRSQTPKIFDKHSSASSPVRGVGGVVEITTCLVFFIIESLF